MPTPAVIVSSLGKRYRIGAPVVRPRTLKEAISSAAAAPLRNLAHLRRLSRFGESDEADVIWALRDVSFELAHGEVLGVIGNNGAGKSTLLKILSRITKPTTGRARVAGRVGSLLEVGTGFHPELTGRDNVYLNGSILGMNRAHIARKFDEIVEFAGVRRLIDTPVKRYSSGMYLRLAFAVAAHLEPDVLLMDEVLAVGDAEFQEKCLTHMGGVARQGRTVLFVSHNLSAVRRLCTRAVLIQDGRIAADGGTADVVSRYVSTTGCAQPDQWMDLSFARHGGSGIARFVAASYTSGAAETGCLAYPGGPLEFRAVIQATTGVARVTIGFTLRDQYGTILMSGSTGARGSVTSLREGASAWAFRIPALCLNPGTYLVDLWVGDPLGATHDDVEPALRVNVVDRQVRTLGTSFDPRYDGPVFCPYEITAVPGDDASLRHAPQAYQRGGA
jgi:ABC-type polysaccharide/polyol phosphate transport system ATPase subunit